MDRDEIEPLVGDECDPHMALCRSETRETRLVCCLCGRRAQGNYSLDDEPMCDRCGELP